MKTAFLFSFYFLALALSETALAQSYQSGKILYLLQQGQHAQAISLYRQDYQELGVHDFELVHRIGLGLLDDGFRQSDPEIQLLTLFGASVSAHEDAYYILEESLKSAYPQIQLVALQALARCQHDPADQALLRAMGSNHLILRLEALQKLCNKKHPQTVAQAESLMAKTPKEILPVYPQFYASMGTPDSTRVLRRLLNHGSEDVRVAAILSAARYNRDDLLPFIRQQALQLNYKQQEAVAYALGKLKDEASLSKLERLANSPYPAAALAARQALCQFGRKEHVAFIRESAKAGDLFAIAVLGEMPEEIPTLLELADHQDLNIRLNATLALLEHHHPSCVFYLKNFLIRDKRDLAFTQIDSPGGVFKAWKAISSSSQLLKNDLSAYLTHLELKESMLEQARELPDVSFLQLAELILANRQNLLVPSLCRLLQDLGDSAAIDLLKKYQQTPGSPLVRQYCNLALYSLKEPGPYGEQLQQWVKSQSKQDLIRFRPFVPWQLGKSQHELTPEETSRLLIEAFEAFAANQDEQGLNALFEAIQYGHAKNKYALAGLLLRATD